MKPNSQTPLVGETKHRDLFGHALLFVMVPFFMFMGTMGCYYFLYHHSSGLGLALTTGCVLLELFFCTGLLMNKRRWVQQVGMMSLGMVFAGVVAAMYNEYTNLVYYHRYLALNIYTNVLPTAPIQTILDAGVLYFSSTTAIVSSKGAAFKSFKTPGTTFCVAPVLDETYQPTDDVGLWAVGENCCGKRASFYCDDAENPKAHSAIVLLPASEVLPPWAVSLGAGVNHYDDYLDALKLAESAFGTSAAQDVRLLRWTADVAGFIENFRQKGVQYWSDAGLAAFFALITVVFVLIQTGQFN